MNPANNTERKYDQGCTLRKNCLVGYYNCHHNASCTGPVKGHKLIQSEIQYRIAYRTDIVLIPSSFD